MKMEIKNVTVEGTPEEIHQLLLMVEKNKINALKAIDRSDTFFPNPKTENNLPNYVKSYDEDYQQRVKVYPGNVSTNGSFMNDLNAIYGHKN